MDLKYTVPISECEIMEKEGDKPTKVRVSGTCLVPTISRNGNKYSIKHIEENEGKEVKFFMQEHDEEGSLKVSNVVGKVSLVRENDLLKYVGILRNTSTHKDVVEHAINKEIDVSIDARAYGKKVVDGVYEYEKVDIRALCGVGVGGISENSMDIVIAESFRGVDEQVNGNTIEQNVLELEQKHKEEKKMEDIDTLKKALAEKEQMLKEFEEKDRIAKVEAEKKMLAEKDGLMREIKSINPAVSVDSKSLDELRLVLEYEKKLKEQMSNGFGVVEKDKSVAVEEDIIVEHDKDEIRMGTKMYRDFVEQINKSIYK